MGIRIPLTAAYHAEGVRIATPACGLVRNDRFFDKRYGAFRRRGEGTPPYAWVEGVVCGRRRGVGDADPYGCAVRLCGAKNKHRPDCCQGRCFAP